MVLQGLHLSQVKLCSWAHEPCTSHHASLQVKLATGAGEGDLRLVVVCSRGMLSVGELECLGILEILNLCFG